MPITNFKPRPFKMARTLINLMIKASELDDHQIRGKRILQRRDEDQDSRDTDAELLQQQLEAQIDLGEDGKVSAGAIAR